MDHVHTIVAMYRTVSSCDNRENHNNWLPLACKTTFHLNEGSAMAHLGVRDFEIHWISRGFQIGLLYFTCISGFLDFKVDFWISKWILDVDSGFCLKNYYLLF